MAKYYLKLKVTGEDGLNIDIEGEVKGALAIQLKGLEKIVMGKPKKTAKVPAGSQAAPKQEKVDADLIYQMIGDGMTNKQIREVYPGIADTKIGAYRAHYTRRQKNDSKENPGT